MTGVAAVVIGRNEGTRLERALRSVLPHCNPVVYVDSASTDGSPETARAMGADVLALDLSIPFTFGRARNAGARRVRSLVPNTDYVQFVDADSEVVATWFSAGAASLSQQPQLAAVHGRVRERYAGSSVYNRLFELEFDPRNEDDAVFGGMALLRLAPLLELHGYDEELRCFEDHDLSQRLRQAGWSIARLESDMVIHENRMARWSDWWTRERRAGYARAQLVTKYGFARSHPGRRGYLSAWFWSLGIPLSGLIASVVLPPVLLLIPAAYVGFWYRVFRHKARDGFQPRDAALYAAGRVVGKFPQLHGAMAQLIVHLRST